MGHTSPPPPSTFPLPVGTTQAARCLIRTHQYLRGELLKDSDDEYLLVPHDVCREQMAAIETLLRFFDVNFDPSALKARRAYPKVGPLSYGQVRAGALHALKVAGEWQTYRQIADAIVRRQQLHLTSAQHKHFLQKLREAVHALKRAGAVVCEHPGRRGDPIEQRWRLSAMFD
jgi:hypothetical protein